MDDELHGWTKSSDFEYFFVKNLVSKYNLLKEAIIIGKAQIIKKKAVGGMTKKFCTTLHMPSVTYLRNNISYIQLELSL